MTPEPTTHAPARTAAAPPLWQDGRRLAIIGGVLFVVAYLLQQTKLPDDPYRRQMGGVVNIPGVGTFAFWGWR